MEMSNDLASIATGVKVSADFLRGIPEPLKQVIGMFWSFSFKQMYHGYRTAMQHGGMKSVATYFSTLMIASYPASLLLTGVIDLLAGKIVG